MLTTTVMATRAPVIIAPAMNTNMYTNRIVQANMDKLGDLGYRFIDPASGRLACGDIGAGKLADVDDILAFIVDFFEKESEAKDLAGRRIMISAGPTIEAIDPVRYITNRSSGKMGYAIAKRAVARGAQVTLVSGKTDLCRNKDIAQELGKIKGNKVLVGFAAETNDVLENAAKKIKKKNLDFIVANDLTMQGAGFSTETNIVKIIEADGRIKEYPKLLKSEVGDIILDKVRDILENK